MSIAFIINKEENLSELRTKISNTLAMCEGFEATDVELFWLCLENSDAEYPQSAYGLFYALTAFLPKSVRVEELELNWELENSHACRIKGTKKLAD